MNESQYLVKQLTDELAIPESGKQSVVLVDNAKTKVILFTFAAGGGLALPSMLHHSMQRFKSSQEQGQSPLMASL